ncbi:hypothetical protein HAX54_027829, partial [Datura stramonium]|nr:hypothetical protein [Datura stramonium]
MDSGSTALGSSDFPSITIEHWPNLGLWMRKCGMWFGRVPGRMRFTGILNAFQNLWNTILQALRTKLTIFRRAVSQVVCGYLSEYTTDLCIGGIFT